MSSKYPRTPHLPGSPGGTKDDRRLADVSHLLGRELVVTEKLDGSNLCMTREAVYARSHSGPPNHPSFDAAKALHAQIALGIDHHLSVFGEWCWAVHSIRYAGVPNPPFFVFGVRDDLSGRWWAWDDVLVQAEILGLHVPPYAVRSGVRRFTKAQDLERFAGDVLPSCQGRSVFGGDMEGLVLRVVDEYDDPALSTAKYVRAGHVAGEHWTAKAVERQPLVAPNLEQLAAFG